MSMSRRARFMLQHQLRHRVDGQLNLIPFIDILTVMVSFLLVYSTNVEVVQNSKGIEIPQSIAERQPRTTVVVMLTKEDLFVQGERIASVADIQATAGDIIGPLRDALKRPLMGRAARELSDYVIVTNDNPRREDPQIIIDGILAGMRNGAGAAYEVVPDRAAAIDLAVRSAEDGDVVIIAGKGHEAYQLIGEESLPFSDAVVARAAIEKHDK